MAPKDLQKEIKRILARISEERKHGYSSYELIVGLLKRQIEKLRRGERDCFRVYRKMRATRQVDADGNIIYFELFEEGSEG